MSLWDDFVMAYSPFPDRAMQSLLPYIQKLVNEQEMRLVITMKSTIVQTFIKNLRKGGNGYGKAR